MYIEAALLKLYFFIDGSKMKHILMRLAMMSRSIGDTMSVFKKKNTVLFII